MARNHAPRRDGNHFDGSDYGGPRMQRVAPSGSKLITLPVIPQGAGLVHPPFLFLIFLLAVLRVSVSAPG
jgi:hypothetical protein